MAVPTRHSGTHDWQQGELRNNRLHIYPTKTLADADPNKTARIIYVEDTAQVYYGRAGTWAPLSASGTSGGWLPPVGTVGDLAALTAVAGDAVVVVDGDGDGNPAVYMFDGTDWKDATDDTRLILANGTRPFTAFPSVEVAAGAPSDDRHLITKDYADATFETPAGAQAKADGVISAHVAEPDPHAQYTTAAAAGAIAVAAAGAAVTAHESEVDPHPQYTTDAEATLIATAVAGPIAAAAVSAHESDPAAHLLVFDNHNADTSAHEGVLARVTSLETLLYANGRTGDSLSSTLLFVDPDVDYANPVRFDAVRGIFRAMRDNNDTAVGLAMRPSTVFSAYTGLSVQFTATRIVLPNNSWQRIVPGMYLRFPGSTNNDWFFVEGIDAAAGELLVSPNPTTAETVSTNVEFLTPDGGVVFFGQFPLYDGQERWRDLPMIEIVQDTGVVVLGLPVPGVSRGDFLTIAGNTAGNDGSYEIASFEASTIQLQLVPSVILAANVDAIIVADEITLTANVDAITVATNEVTLSDTTGILSGDTIGLAGTTDNDGFYSVASVAGLVVTTVQDLPGTDQAVPAGTSTVTRSVFAAVTLSDTTGVLPGDSIVLTGTTDNNGQYIITSVDGLVVSVAEPLPGTDQAGPAGTFTVSRMVSPLVADDTEPDGTATIERPTAPHPFAAMADGDPAVPYFYNGAAPELLSATPAKWEIGYQVNNDAFFVRCGLSIHNVAVIDAPQTFEGGQRGGITTLVEAAPVAIDMDDNNIFTLTLTAARTLDTPTNPTVGQVGFIEVKQDAIGGHVLAFHIDWEFVGGVTPVLSTAASAVEYLHYFVAPDGTLVISLLARHARLDQPQTFEGGQRGAIVTLLDDVTIAIDMDDGNNFAVTLEGNRTLGDPANLVPGQSGSIEARQDLVGGRTLDYHATWHFAGGVKPVLTTAASAVDLLAYYVDSTGTPVIGAAQTDYKAAP